MACQSICEQWETDTQQTYINNRLIGPAGGVEMHNDRREGSKIRTCQRTVMKGDVVHMSCET